MTTTQETDSEIKNLRKRLNVDGHVVNQATADLPDEQKSAIRWLHSHAYDLDLTLDELAARVRYDKNTIYQIFTGRHNAGKANVTEAILAYKRVHESREGATKLAYIPTKLTERIWKLCEGALTYQRVSFIFGDSQIGKTTALMEYARCHNHGQTIYVSVPTGGAMANFLPELCAALRINSQLRESELRRRIMASFDANMLLIVDEAHQCFFVGAPVRSLRTLEFIRELHDKAKCGVVISGTNVFRNEIESGRSAGVLAQLKRRRLAALQLPNTPSGEDLDTFARAYGLEPATGDAAELQASVIQAEALGMWLTLLRIAANLAHKKKQTMTWAHVLRAHAALTKLED